MSEFDRLTRDAFLETYRYGKARDYLLVHEGREYDSKAVAGIAHKYDHGRPLTNDEFSGGRDHVVAWLKRAGFQVKVIRNPDRVRDELILACALVAENDWRGLDAKDQQVL